MRPSPRCAVLLLLTLAGSRALPAQLDPHQVPRRPHLPAEADSNSAREYFRLGISQMAKHPQDAAAAFYWASRLDPSWPDPVYGRHVALLVAHPLRVIDGYVLRDRNTMKDPRIRAIDSVAYQALLINPWLDRRFDGTLLDTWIEGVTGSPTVWAGEVRQRNPWAAGWISYNQGKFPDAVADFTEGLKREPGSPWTLLARARSYVVLGRVDSAVADARSALATLRQHNEEWVTLSYVAEPFVEYGIGYLYEQMQQRDSARAAYERALLDDVAFYPAHRRLAFLRLAAADTAGAVAELQQATTINPGYAVALFEYGMLNLATGHPDSAIAIFGRARDAEPWYPAPRLALAKVYDRYGFAAEALAEYQAFVARAPKSMASQLEAAGQRIAALKADQ